MSENRFLDALALGVAFYRGTAKAVVGTPVGNALRTLRPSLVGFRSDRQSKGVSRSRGLYDFRQSSRVSRIRSIALMPDMPTKGEQYEFFAELVTICADYCIVLDRT